MDILISLVFGIPVTHRFSEWVKAGNLDVNRCKDLAMEILKTEITGDMHHLVIMI